MQDYYSDNGALFARIFASRDLPKFVSDGVESDKTASMDSGGFADPNNRKLPINTAADTYISAAYFSKQGGDSNSKVAERIMSAARIFGIEDDVSDVMKYASSLVEQEPEVEAPKIASFEVDCGMPELLPIKGSGPDAVQKCAQFILDNVENIPVASLIEAGKTMVKAAEDNGTEIDAVFDIYSGKHASDNSHISDQKMIRLAFIPDPAQKKAAIEELEAVDSPVKLAEFDLARGLDKMYGKNMEHPCFVFFSGSAPEDVSMRAKIAKDLDATGSCGIAFQAIEAALGRETADNVLAKKAELSDEDVDKVSRFTLGQI